MSSASDGGAAQSALATVVSLPGATQAARERSWERTLAYDHGRRDYLQRRVLVACDAAALSCALLLGFEVTGIRPVTDVVWLLPFLPVWIALLAIYRLYERDVKRINQSSLDDLPWFFHALVIGGLVMWVYYRAIPVHPLVAEELFVFGIASLVLLLLLRTVGRQAFIRAVGPDRVLLIGEAPGTPALVSKMRAHPEYAIETVAVISHNRTPHPQAGPVIATLPDLHELTGPGLRELIGSQKVGRIIVAQQEVSDQLMLNLLQVCGRLNVKVTVVPRHVETIGPSVEVDDIEGVTVLDLNPLVLSHSSRLLKRSLDVVGAGLGLLLLAPVMGLIALAIKLDSRGPVLFKQRRIGRGGRGFSVWKFRTMVPDAEELASELRATSETTSWLKLKRDPRVTRLGRVLRLTSLDELPQLWNVLVGKMSLVGPRPLIPEEEKLIQDWGRARLDLAPGLTGLWQVLGRADIPFEQMVKLDYVYVTNWSLWMDIRLLLQTFPAVARRRGAN